MSIADLVKGLVGKGTHRHWNPEVYRRFVEYIDDAVLQEYQRTELSLILQLPDLRSRTVVDLGCGYGRIFPHIEPYAKGIVGIDINKQMLTDAKREASKYANVKVVKADISKDLPMKLIREFGDNPVLVCLQNTLGTLEGSAYAAVQQMDRISHISKADIVLSIFCQEALHPYGVSLYTKLRTMVGEIDFEKTSYVSGLLVTKTGYTSNWWTPKARTVFKNTLFWGSRTAREVSNGVYWILHVSHLER